MINQVINWLIAGNTIMIFVIFLAVFLFGSIAYWEAYVNRRNGLTRAMSYVILAFSLFLLFTGLILIRPLVGLNGIVRLVFWAGRLISLFAILHSIVFIALEIKNTSAQQ